MVQPATQNPFGAAGVQPLLPARSLRSSDTVCSDRSPRRAHRVRLRTRIGVTRSTVEAAALALVAALLLFYFGTVLATRILRSGPAPVLAITIAPGDTLWSLADRYGAPDVYILKRVDRLAAYNHLVPGAHLQPGQVLSVPVENPAELQRAYTIAKASR